MKKQVYAVAGLLAALGILWAASFAWKNLRGVGPVVKAPPGDITKLIVPGANNTGMPLTVPQGFSVSIFAKDLGKPRVMTWDPAGRLLVSIPASGKVVALPDENGDRVADKVITVAEGLNRPHGLAFRCEGSAGVQHCVLYVAESDKLVAYDYEQGTPTVTNKRTLIDLPDGGHHVTRTLLFMPFPDENTLLISVGSTCNVCYEKDWRRAKVLSVNPDGRGLAVFASGLRNAVFMAIHPVTGKIWATEMGRDLLGDDLPPDEINIVEEGRDYGWPVCFGKNIHDTNFDKNQYIRDPCADKVPSHIDLQAHSAPLGLAFIPEEGWPEDYWYDLLVAYHGSWNRSVPTGYSIVRFKLDAEGNVEGAEDFMTGWLTGEGALGRPVDILVQPGGSMYISDDKAGVIYRVSRQ